MSQIIEVFMLPIEKSECTEIEHLSTYGEALQLLPIMMNGRNRLINLDSEEVHQGIRGTKLHYIRFARG